MAILKDLIVNGVSRFIGDIFGSKFIVNGGTSSLFLKADGSLDGTTYCSNSDSRLSNARTPTSHTHGNITNDGKVGSTASLPLITTTGGAVTTGSFGTTAGTFCLGNDSRLSNSRPASDVYSWAKASTKPSYNLDEVSDGTNKKWANKIGKTIEITWSNLKSARDNSQLIPGQWYRITDYQTTTTQENTQSAGHRFDIIVRADAANMLNENAFAAKHSGDTYFTNAGAKLEAWELKYCIDNDTTRFSWAKTSGGKGVIYWMKDDHNNECPYDFKNIQFKRYRLKNKNYLHLADYPLGEEDYQNVVQKAFDTLKERMGTQMNSNNISLYYTRGMYEDGYIVSGAEIFDFNSDYESYDSGGLVFDENSGGNYVSMLYSYDFFDIIAEVENTTGEWFYTFSKKASASAAATDASFDSSCHHNIIKKSVKLNDNVFMVLGSSLSCFGNSFGINCYNNSIGNGFYNNSIGNGFYNNTIGYNFQCNIIGNDCYNSSIGNNFQWNSIGNNFYYNSIGSSFERNSIGNSFQGNSIGDNIKSNSIGNDFYFNTIGNSCLNNSIGNGCSYNFIIGYFDYNSIGNMCYNIFFNKNYTRMVIIENGNSSIDITSTQTTSSSKYLCNFTIAQCCNNDTTIRKTISHNSVNDKFKTTYQPANSKVVSV